MTRAWADRGGHPVGGDRRQRADVHRGRAECDAVGIQAVLKNGPELTVRDADDQPPARRPLRVVAGRPIPATAKVRAVSASPTTPPRTALAGTPQLPAHDPAEVRDLGVESIGRLRRFTLEDVNRFGADLRLTLMPQPQGQD